MKALRLLALIPLCSLGLMVWAQQGPRPNNSETVARPKKGGSSTPAEPEQEQIPSKFGKQKELPEGVPTFSTDAVTVSVDVAVLDNKGHFIPKIPKDKFRILEDNVPQQVTGYTMGEGPMTIALVVEFSNRFQQYYSQTWYETITASYT